LTRALVESNDIVVSTPASASIEGFRSCVGIGAQPYLGDSRTEQPIHHVMQATADALPLVTNCARFQRSSGRDPLPSKDAQIRKAILINAHSDPAQLGKIRSCGDPEIHFLIASG
jgi:hypothetical protein